MVLQQAQPAPMLVMFSRAPLPESSEIETTTAAVTTVERPSKYEKDKKRGPTIVAPTPEAITSQATTVGMMSMSTTFIQAVAQSLAHSEAQLTQLIQQIRPWVH